MDTENWAKCQKVKEEVVEFRDIMDDEFIDEIYGIIDVVENSLLNQTKSSSRVYIIKAKSLLLGASNE